MGTGDGEIRMGVRNRQVALRRKRRPLRSRSFFSRLHGRGWDGVDGTWRVGSSFQGLFGASTLFGPEVAIGMG